MPFSVNKVECLLPLDVFFFILIAHKGVHIATSEVRLAERRSRVVGRHAKALGLVLGVVDHLLPQRLEGLHSQFRFSTARLKGHSSNVFILLVDCAEGPQVFHSRIPIARSLSLLEI